MGTTRTPFSAAPRFAVQESIAPTRSNVADCSPSAMYSGIAIVCIVSGCRGGVDQIITTRSGSRNVSEPATVALRTLNTPAFAPMPSASEPIAAAVNPGDRDSDRTP